MIVAQLIKFLAEAVLGSGLFDRILARVKEWGDKEISGSEKRNGVLGDLTKIGVDLSESLARLGIELAVQYLKRVS